MTTTDKIIALAQSKGSTATTHAGARRYLIAAAGKLAATLPPIEKRGLVGNKYNYNIGVPNRNVTRQQWRSQRAAEIVARLDASRTRAAEFAEWQAARAEQVRASLAAAWPLAVSRSSWAGGDHHISIRFGDAPMCRGWSERVWSDNKKWSGTDSYAELTVTYQAIRLLGTGGLLIAGMITLDAEEVAPREYRAVWVEQARGFDLKPVSGWIIRGHHVRGGTLERARKTAGKARQKALEAAFLQREQKRRARIENETLKNVWVTVSDSLNAGNCKPATESVRAEICRRLGGNVAAVRADYLLSIRDDYYSRRAIAKAAARNTR